MLFEERRLFQVDIKLLWKEMNTMKAKADPDTLIHA